MERSSQGAANGTEKAEREGNKGGKGRREMKGKERKGNKGGKKREEVTGGYRDPCFDWLLLGIAAIQLRLEAAALQLNPVLWHCSVIAAGCGGVEHQLTAFIIITVQLLFPLTTHLWCR